MEEKGAKKDINYWRGFKELNNDPAFIKAKENEFCEGDSPESYGVRETDGISRRKFLALLASSAALAAASCSDYRDKGAIVPYNKKPEEITVGNPNYYASTCASCKNACGILIKTREGRPIKIDGNKDHPVSAGKICAIGQASILNLYDPNRLKEPGFRVSAGNFVPVSWQDADAKVIEELKKASAAGKEIAVITHTVLSPTLKKLFEDFKAAYPTVKIYSYELISDYNKRSAFRKCYGNELMPSVKLNEAKVILALESDFLGTEGNIPENTRLYAETKNVMSKNDFSRLYSVEGAMSLTGSNADYRIRLKTDLIEEFILALINELASVKKISSYESAISQVVSGFELNAFTKKHNINKEAVEQLVNDLAENQGKSIAFAGLMLPESAHIAVNLLNEIIGGTKLYAESVNNTEIPLSGKEEIAELIAKMNSGSVGAVIHYDTNPVYHWPKDYNYEEAIKKVPFTVSFAEAHNETTLLSSYVLASNHNYESWGDFKPRTGVFSLQQPVIAPLYKTRQKEAEILLWTGGNKDAYAENIYMDYIKSYWEKNVYTAVKSAADFRNFWHNSLHDGTVVYREKEENAYNYKMEAFLSANFTKPSENICVLISASHFTGDGRFVDNGWLMEIPHPVSKTVWDNYAAVSPSTAREFGIDSGDFADVSAGGKNLKIPVLVQPGMADKVVEIMSGYGRSNAGPIGTETGFNAGLLLSSKPALSEWFYNDGKITKSEGKYDIVSTQEHYPIDHERYTDIHLKRHIILQGTYEEYKSNPKFLEEQKPETKLFNISKEHIYEGVKWAMAIDMNRCIGCNYCVAACNVENNIPVVGKEQVSRNREMMWIRIDRYYGGTSDDPRVSFQPMLCQHCDNAPCENVCPVAATNHSPDGLNQMAYNRCVGTRYCSNNCPYKVRRFNYYNFRDRLADGYYEQDSLSLLHNPEVTVRSRGVMEKCTFCVQRIMDEKQQATQDARDINGDNVKTACQEACPTSAIVFGDYRKKDSEILKYREHELGYHVLEEGNFRPNVTYLAKLLNIKPEKKHIENN